MISDNAYRLIREGVPKREAIINGTQELSIPILTSTVTTIAAFLPMLTIVGNVGEYVASLPVVVAATLSCSFFRCHAGDADHVRLAVGACTCCSLNDSA